MEITALLNRVHVGDQEALRALIPLVYDELKKLAGAHLAREGRSVTLQRTALVHEAFLKLAAGRHPSYENRRHFYGIASRVMRQILVDAARARSAEKRSAAGMASLTDVPDRGREPDAAVLRMNDALDQLQQTDPLKAKLIEMRYFAGMTVEESAAAMAIPAHTAYRELRLARAWLHREMASGV